MHSAGWTRSKTAPYLQFYQGYIFPFTNIMFGQIILSLTVAPNDFYTEFDSGMDTRTYKKG